MAPHSSTLAWRIPGMGSLVGCHLRGHTETDWCDLAAAAAAAHSMWDLSSSAEDWSIAHCSRSIPTAPPGTSQRKVKVAQLYLTLCDPMDYTVHAILQARILEWVAFPLFRGSSQPRDRTQVSCIAGGFFTSWATREVTKEYLLSTFGVCAKLFQSCPALCDPMNCSLPGSSVNGILRAK